jgi:23S rRNA (uracil1939-C5)-methyltransferase
MPGAGARTGGVLGPLRRLLARRDGRLAVEIDWRWPIRAWMWRSRACRSKACSNRGLLDFARDNGLARLCLDQGYGPESLWDPMG